jgi:hypothetical protein
MKRADLTALIEGIGTGEKNTAAEMRNLLAAFRDGISLTGDMKPINCDAAYIAINFTAEGLGRLERDGWAICNGLNGTWDIRDRTLIGYGGDYTTPGFPFGSKDTVLPSHSHTLSIKKHTNNQGSVGLFDQANGGGNQDYTTSIAGESATNKNYQPSIVVVWIQKL